MVLNLLLESLLILIQLRALLELEDYSDGLLAESLTLDEAIALVKLQAGKLFPQTCSLVLLKCLRSVLDSEDLSLGLVYLSLGILGLLQLRILLK